MIVSACGPRKYPPKQADPPLVGDDCECPKCKPSLHVRALESRHKQMPKAKDVGKPLHGHVPMWEENQLLRQQLEEANATIARLHQVVSQHRRDRKHLG